MIATEKFRRAPELEAWLEHRLLPEAMRLLQDADTIGDLDGATEVFPRDPDDTCLFCGAAPDQETSLIEHEADCAGLGIHRLVDEWHGDCRAPGLLARVIDVLKEALIGASHLGCEAPSCFRPERTGLPCESCPLAAARSVVAQCRHLGARR